MLVVLIYLMVGELILLLCLLTEAGDDDLRDSFGRLGPSVGALGVMGVMVLLWPVVLALILSGVVTR